MQSTSVNPYRAAAAALELDTRAARVLMRAAAKARVQSRTAARRAKAAQFLAIAFA